MTLEEVCALFVLSGFTANEFTQIENQYWPNVDMYAALRAANPWWMVETKFGTIQLGWRKRVIAIDWSATEIRGVVTQDDVTKGVEMVHAYSYGDAVKYLTTLYNLCKRKEYENAASDQCI